MTGKITIKKTSEKNITICVTPSNSIAHKAIISPPIAHIFPAY
jgi:hypothetical protein